jgi:hypothetical protein
MDRLADRRDAEAVREIPLSKGFVALVDAADYDWLSQWKWHARVKPNGAAYAARAGTGEEGKRGSVLMHRVILGAEPPEYGDHISGDTLDNRRDNLRLCTKTQNNRNKRRSRTKKHPFKGVFWNGHKSRWFSVICVDRKRINLGSSKNDPERCARLYDAAARKYFGEFASLNFPGEEGVPMPAAPDLRAKLSASQRTEIAQAIAAGATIATTAVTYGVSRATILRAAGYTKRTAPMVGEGHPAARLSVDDVHAIRAAYVRGQIGYSRLAVRFGVSPATIERVITGVSWSHVPVRLVAA